MVRWRWGEGGTPVRGVSTESGHRPSLGGDRHLHPVYGTDGVGVGSGRTLYFSFFVEVGQDVIFSVSVSKNSGSWV